MSFEMRFDVGILDLGERSLPFGLLVSHLSGRQPVYDIKISTNETNKVPVVYQPPPGRLPFEVIRQKLQVGDKFIYLCSTSSRTVHIDDGLLKPAHHLADYMEMILIEVKY